MVNVYLQTGKRPSIKRKKIELPRVPSIGETYRVKGKAPELDYTKKVSDVE